MIHDGASRLDAARQADMDRQTLRDWVHRYNQAGIDGLVSQAPGGLRIIRRMRRCPTEIPSRNSATPPCERVLHGRLSIATYQHARMDCPLKASS